MSAIIYGAIGSIIAVIVITLAARTRVALRLLGSTYRLAQVLRTAGITEFHLSRDDYTGTLRTYLSKAKHSLAKAQSFLRTPFNESAPRFSPDGRWLAYSSDEYGRYEINVQPYPGPGGKWEISTEGGTEPVWNPNGREMFYRSGNKMMAVDIATQPSFTVGKPRVLFEGP